MSANSYYTSTAPCTTVLENAVNPAHPCLLANTSQTSNPFEAMAKTSRHARSKSLSILRDLAYKRRHTFYKSTIAANPILLWRMAQFGWEIIHPVTIYLSFNHRETLSTAAQCSVLRGGRQLRKIQALLLFMLTYHWKQLYFPTFFYAELKKGSKWFRGGHMLFVLLVSTLSSNQDHLNR